MNSGRTLSEEIECRMENWSPDDIAEWLRDLLLGRPCDPEIPADAAELHHTLIAIFNSSSIKFQSLLREASCLLLESTPLVRNNIEIMYYLLVMAGFMKPIRGKRVLSNFIYSGVLQEMVFEDFNLHYLAMAVYGKYDVDSDLANYIWRTASPESSMSYLLLCINLLFRHSARDACRFIEILLPKLREQDASLQLARELRSVISDVGCKDIYIWFSTTKEKLRDKEENLYERLRSLLEEDVISWIKAENDDSYAVLLAAELGAGYHFFSSRELLNIAKTIRVVPYDLVKSTLTDIWSATRKRLGILFPWSIQGPRGLAGRIYRSEPESALVTGQDLVPIDIKEPEAVLLERTAAVALIQEEEDVFAYA